MLCACIKSSAYFVNPPLRHGGKPHGGKLLKGRGVKRNSSSCYLRTLRTLYRKAVEAGLTTDKNIFRHVFTGFAKTAKRAIPLSSLRAIRLLRLPEDSVVAFARDLFMLSVYLQGISFVDLAYLKKDDIRNGQLHYSRKKTGQELTVSWEPAMQDIVDNYAHDERQPVLTAHHHKGGRHGTAAVRADGA